MALWKPSRRLFLAGAGLIAAPAIVRAQSPQIRRLMLNQMPVAAAAPTGSAWDPSGHGSNATLSTTTIANDTATGNISDWGSVRGTQSYSAGKRYFEVKIVSAPGTANFIIGLIDASTSAGSMNDFNIIKSSGHYMFNGTAKVDGAPVVGGTNLGAGWSLSNGDTMAVAYDADNQFHYLSLNNVWFLSGVPTSGASGTGAVAAYINPQVFFPWIVVWGASNGVYQLKTSAPFAGTVPSGYSAWG